MRIRSYYVDGYVYRIAFPLDDGWMRCTRCDMDFHELSLGSLDHLAGRCPLTKARVK